MFSSGFFQSILATVFASPTFQQGLITLLKSLGQMMINNANNPQALVTIGQDLKDHPQTLLGALVANTPHEPLAPDGVIDAAKKAVQETGIGANQQIADWAKDSQPSQGQQAQFGRRHYETQNENQSASQQNKEPPEQRPAGQAKENKVVEDTSGVKAPGSSSNRNK